jgi:hypothetical protein
MQVHTQRSGSMAQYALLLAESAQSRMFGLDAAYCATCFIISILCDHSIKP